MAFTQTNLMAKYIPEFFFKNGQLTDDIMRYVDEGKENVDTVRGTLFVVLVSNGLFPDPAKEILDDLFATLPPLKQIEGRSIEGYPDPMRIVMWLAICKYALKWIDANVPQHFARPMFEPPPRTPTLWEHLTDTD